MAEHRASCQCGGLKLHISGDPDFVIACHCQACQKRTGAPFGAGAYFLRDAVNVTGERREWVRDVVEGRQITNHFCPACGTTVFWGLDLRPNLFGIAIGTLDTPKPTPQTVIWAQEQLDWVALPDEWKTYQRSTAEG